MSLNRVLDIVDASRMPDFPAKDENGNTLRVIHSIKSLGSSNPTLDQFNMVCFSLHGGSPHHLPRKVRKRLKDEHGIHPAYLDYFNTERDHGANEMIEGFVEKMRYETGINVLGVIVKPPRGLIDCNRYSRSAVSLNLGSRELYDLLLKFHSRITDVLFDVQEATNNRRVATIDFHTMAPKSTDGIDRDRIIRARQRGRKSRKLALKDLPEHVRVWNHASQFGTPRPIAVIYKDADGNQIGDNKFAMAVKNKYSHNADDQITIAVNTPYVTNPTFPGAKLIAGNGFHFEVPKHLVTEDFDGYFEIWRCKGDRNKAREIIGPLVKTSAEIVRNRVA